LKKEEGSGMRKKGREARRQTDVFELKEWDLRVLNTGGPTQF